MSIHGHGEGLWRVWIADGAGGGSSCVRTTKAVLVAARVETVFEFHVCAGSSSQLVVRTRVVAMRPPLHAMG